MLMVSFPLPTETELWQEYCLTPAKVSCGSPSQGSAFGMGGPATWLAFDSCVEDGRLPAVRAHVHSALLGHGL